MDKYLVQIEFRYNDAQLWDNNRKGIYFDRSKLLTIGVYDTINEARDAAHKELDYIAELFGLFTYPNDTKAKKVLFYDHGPNVITNKEYINTPFDFFVKINTLECGHIGEAITEAVEATNRYKQYLKYK